MPDESGKTQAQKQYEEKIASDKKAFNKLNNLPKGEDRDNALTDYLRDHCDQDTYDYMVDRMFKTSGDLFSGKSVSKANKQAMDEYHAAVREYDGIESKITEQATRATRNRGQKFEDIRKNIRTNSAEYKEARNKVNTSFEKYCVTVLKDMGLPVNDKTLEYIEGIIYWN